MSVFTQRGSLKSLEDNLTNLLSDIREIRAGEMPPAKVLRDAPIIEQWSCGLIPAGCIVGSVRGHPILGDRAHVHTSHLVLIDRENGWARTWSRYYRLGLPERPSDS
jgi:hypothetical protein